MQQRLLNTAEMGRDIEYFTLLRLHTISGITGRLVVLQLSLVEDS